MASVNKEMIDDFIQVLESPATDLAARVAKADQLEDDTDVMMHDITDYLIRCSTNELSDSHASMITSMIRIVAECEEISDCEYRLMKLMERKVEKQHDMNTDVISALQKHAQSVSEFIEFYSSRLFKQITAADLKEANRLENAIDNQRRLINRSAMTRMQDGGDIKAEMLNVDLSNQLEKIGNHALNVMETSHEMSQGYERG